MVVAEPLRKDVRLAEDLNHGPLGGCEFDICVLELFVGLGLYAVLNAPA